MQKILINLLGVLLVLFLAIAATSGASAAPAAVSAAETDPASGPFQGIFYGWVQGDQGSQAPMILDLTHQGDTVEGDIYLGEGLVVDGGICGAASVPSGVQSASGRTDPKNPDEFDTDVEFEFSGLEIGVQISSRVSEGGDSLAAEAEIDLPWFCGADPVLSGTLIRYQAK